MRQELYYTEKSRGIFVLQTHILLSKINNILICLQ